MTVKWRGIGRPDSMKLTHACMIVKEALGEDLYLVGSAIEKREYRDVDVRAIFDDEKYKALFGTASGSATSPFWSLLCASISVYLQQMTGLNVDFQIQCRSKVTEADWDKHRIPVVVFSANAKPDWCSK